MHIGSDVDELGGGADSRARHLAKAVDAASHESVALFVEARVIHDAAKTLE